jgi:hypothetical protein
MRTRQTFGRLAAIGLAVVTMGSLSGTTASAGPAGPAFGRHVTVVDPSMPVAEIQAKLDAVAARQVDNEMGTDRYAFLFEPGTYGTAEHPLQFQVGYYTEVAGLGAAPSDAVVNGKIEVYNRCLADGGTGNCVALVNFWRTLCNLSLRVKGAGRSECRSGADFWAVSQAVSMRRVQVTGGALSLMDYCTAGPQYASGGFIADSALPRGDQRLATAVADPQQHCAELEQRGVEPGLRRGRGRPAGDELPGPALHGVGHHAGQPGEAVPLRRRLRRLPGAGRHHEGGCADLRDRLSVGSFGVLRQVPAVLRQVSDVLRQVPPMSIGATGGGKCRIVQWWCPTRRQRRRGRSEPWLSARRSGRPAPGGRLAP